MCNQLRIHIALPVLLTQMYRYYHIYVIHAFVAITSIYITSMLYKI